MNHSEIQTEPKSTGVKASLKVMAVLSIIANLILCAVFFVVMYEVWSVTNMDRLILKSGSYAKSDVLLAILLLILFCVVSAFGAFKMLKGKFLGLIIYSIANGLWVTVAVFFGSGDPFSMVYAGFSIAFMLYFFIQRQELS